VPTAVLGGVVMLSTLLLLMNYNHPYAKDAKEFFISVPIIPVVRGTVISVDAEPNKPLKQGDPLFRIDPQPFQIEVARTKAQLAEAEQQVKQDEASLAAAKARAKQAEADRDRSRQTFERYSQGQQRSAGAFSEQEVENRRQLYFAAEAGLDAAQSELTRAELLFTSEIDGVHTRVAQLQADLEEAQYNLDHSVVRAPTDGMVTQLALRPGMLAVPLPLRPTMVFIPDQRREIVGSFWQNSLGRIKEGYEAEVILEAVPGHVFKGKLKTLVPAMSEGDLQSSGNLVSADSVARSGRVVAVIELEEDLNDYGLPRGVQGSAAVYSDHLEHVAVMRRILLRMVGWLNYLFPVK
jgi:multidrug resistance efflux pump